MIQPETLTPASLAGIIDHTFLKPFGTPADIEKLCQEALRYRFAMVAINPAEVETCVRLLQGSGVDLAAPVALQCELELALRAHARKARGVREDGGGGHGVVVPLLAVR